MWYLWQIPRVLKEKINLCARKISVKQDAFYDNIYNVLQMLRRVLWKQGVVSL